MASEELKPCPFCGGDVSFHKDEECAGCHFIQCGQCRAFFDFATGADPENESESVDELRARIAPAWNRRAQDFDAMRQRVELLERLLTEVRQRCPLPDWARSRIDTALSTWRQAQV